MSKYTEEELKEFEEQAAIEEFEAQEKAREEALASGQTHQIVRDEQGTPMTVALDPEQEARDIKAGQESPVMGAAMGAVEGIPFAKDVMAVTEAGINAASGKADSFGEAYNLHMAEWDEAINKAEEKHPSAFAMGDIYAGVATSTLGSGLKGLKALGAAATYGGLSGVSRSENRGPSDFLLGAGIGAAGDLLGKGLGAVSRMKPMQNFAKKLGILADEATVNVINPADNKKYLNGKLNKIYRKFNQASGRVEVPAPSEVASQFADDLNRLKVRGKPLIDPNDSLDTIVTKFRHLNDDVNDAIGVALKKGDIDLDDKTIKSIYEKHKASLGLDDLRATGSPDAIKKADALENKLLKEYFDEPDFTYIMEDAPLLGANGEAVRDASGNVVMRKVGRKVPTGSPKPKKLSVLDLHKRKTYYAENTNMDVDLSKINQTDMAFYKKGSGVLADEIPDLLDDTPAFRELNKVSRIARVGKELTQKTADSMPTGPLAKLKQSLNMRAAMIMGAGAAGGGPIGAAVGFTVAQLSNASKDPRLNSKVALYLRKAAKSIADGTDGTFVKRLVTASALSEADFQEAVASIASDTSLIESPIKRNYNDIEAKSDLILESLQYHNPELANELRQAFHAEDKEKVNAIMDSVSKDPAMKDFFEDGKGIDGRVYDPADKQQLKDEVNNMEISLNQKLRLEKELDMNGTIPVIQQEPDRFLDYRKRDKDKPRY